jgi:hypothetical protein
MVSMEKEHFPTHGTIKLIVPLHELLIGHVGITHEFGTLVAKNAPLIMAYSRISPLEQSEARFPKVGEVIYANCIAGAR